MVGIKLSADTVIPPVIDGEANEAGAAKIGDLQEVDIAWSGFQVSTIVNTTLSNFSIGAFGVNFNVYAPRSETIPVGAAFKSRLAPILLVIHKR